MTDEIRVPRFEPYQPSWPTRKTPNLHGGTPSNELVEQVVALTAQRDELLAQVCVYRSQADAAERRCADMWETFSAMHDDVQRLQRDNERLATERDTAHARWAAVQ